MRPFGVSLLLAGFDDNGPQLYQIDPSGSYFAWKASAIGKNMGNAKTFLEKRYNEDVRGRGRGAGAAVWRGWGAGGGGVSGELGDCARWGAW